MNDTIISISQSRCAPSIPDYCLGHMKSAVFTNTAAMNI